MIEVVPITWVALAMICAACGRISFDPRADAADAADDSAPACPVTFCDDFDRDPPVDLGWDMSIIGPAAMMSLSNTVNTSPPSSLLIELPAPQLEEGRLFKQLPFATTSARVTFELSYASATPGIAEIDLVRLRWDTPSPGCTELGFFLVRDGTGPFNLQETYAGCQGNFNTALFSLDNTGQFHTVDMLVTFGAQGAARVTVFVDEVMYIDKPTQQAVTPSTLRLEIGGDPARDVVAPWQIRYDDLQVDLR